MFLKPKKARVRLGQKLKIKTLTKKVLIIGFNPIMPNVRKMIKHTLRTSKQCKSNATPRNGITLSLFHQPKYCGNIDGNDENIFVKSI